MRQRRQRHQQSRRKSRRRREFIRIGGDSYRRSLEKKHRNPVLGFLLRPLARLVWYSKQKTRTLDDDNDSVSPDRTALMSFEELSIRNSSSSSSSSPSSAATLDKFPSWHSFSMAEEDAAPPPSPIRPVAEEQPRRLRPWKRFRENRKRAKATNEDCNDDDSEHFSISTDLRQRNHGGSNINITISNSFNSYIPPQPHQPQRVSLETFMAENIPTYTPLHLGDNDGSVDAPTLGVSYDGDYPQLVLQASLDGGRTVESVGPPPQLGAQYTHPAAAAVLEEETWTPRWLDRSMEDLWGGTQWLDDDDDDATSSSSSSLREAPMTMSEWMDEAVAEFSIEDSVRSLSELIEKDVVQPVMEFCAGTKDPTTTTKKRKKILFRIIKRR